MGRRAEAILEKLNRVRLRLRKPSVYCYLRESARGVPHLVVRMEPFDMSICYYARRRDYKWKVFWPWPSGYGPQRYQKCKTEQEVVDYVLGEPTDQ